ncbi:hypothetical protein FRACYDRAFT_244220 [Fragilariopsis cylindrus CCMP1102]|uniref:Uncharacterized protein n=1 Tax=Fragilariopsis cylindrus CCMP1102 TaxID=635003 RepID=A0A1E7F1I5_9STRA|nr:hypothetical protein FRACYDRAFT_244220 [Fragilariopsis cylindrus CCMP1102]|eukprot:OEU12050.1 hypothetical protein FRACYDRAFT_244220 [Fragilariopsis cylindrus CCMP1102]
MSTSIMETNKKNETNTKSDGIIYFRYDQVGPQIVEKGIGSSSSIAPKTHFLSSIPKKYRLLTSDLLLEGGSLDVGLSLHVGSSSDVGSSKLPDGSLETEKLKKNNHKLLLEDYASQKKNVWPQKLHLFEMNPSIAKLPNKYRHDPIWHTYFNNLNNNKGNGDGNMPLYVSVYRITHWNNCYDGTINVKMYGGSWKNVGLGGSNKKTSSNVSSVIPQTDYLGLALLDSNLNIVMDITVTLQTVSTVTFFPNYNDYRLFNFRKYDKDGSGEEQLYLTSVNHIAPIELSLVTSLVVEEVQDQSQGQQQQQMQSQSQQSPRPPKGYIQIPNAFQNDVDVDVTTSTTPLPQFQLQVFIRKYSSCPIGKTINKRAQASKNLLYFQNTHNNNNKKQNTNNTNNNNISNDNIQLLFQPRWNPNEVFQNINLNAKCRLHQKDTTLQYSTTFDPQEPQAREKFETVEKLFYPTYHYEELFVQDRGSACCIDIYVNTTINSDTNNTTKHEYDENQNQNQNKQLQKQNQLLKVAVVHPKTKYPGNNLPLGITPNTYLSRFIAFLPEDPYTILYKSNMFCLPYPTIRRDDEEGGDKTNDNNGSNLNPLTYMKMIPLEFGSMNETGTAYSNCPRIHFVTGMIDKIDHSKDTDNNGEDEDNNNNDNTNNNDFNNNDGSVILSYGVSDCLSRFIEIKKSEIIRMLI